jgi:hypothetical protein
MNERDRQNTTLHTYQSELHQLQLQESKLQDEVKETERLKVQTADNHEFIKVARLRIRVSPKNDMKNEDNNTCIGGRNQADSGKRAFRGGQSRTTSLRCPT